MRNSEYARQVLVARSSPNRRSTKETWRSGGTVILRDGSGAPVNLGGRCCALQLRGDE
jgi:hypothetical protein